VLVDTRTGQRDGTHMCNGPPLAHEKSHEGKLTHPEPRSIHCASHSQVLNLGFCECVGEHPLTSDPNRHNELLIAKHYIYIYICLTDVTFTKPLHSMTTQLGRVCPVIHCAHVARAAIYFIFKSRPHGIESFFLETHTAELSPLGGSNLSPLKTSSKIN
jgi:hypothetical protein